jgi:hypothetical protein
MSLNETSARTAVEKSIKYSKYGAHRFAIAPMMDWTNVDNSKLILLEN